MNELIATPKEMKKVIMNGIRTALLSLGSATKVELSQQLGVSFPTISKFLALMESEGELLEVGLDNSNGGRRAKRYAYNPEYMLGMAIFVEKNETIYTIFNCMGEVKIQGKTASILSEDIEQFAKHIEGIVAKFPKVGAMAIGVPGAVSNGRVIFSPNYAPLQNFDLKGYFEQRLAMPVVVENDMNAAILGYYNKRSFQDNPSLVYLYFGQNGPGAGILINGNVVRGSSSFSGEVSFIPMYDNRTFRLSLYKGSRPSTGMLDQAQIDAVSRLVATCTALINPHTFILSKDDVNEATLRKIADKSADYIEAEHLPELTISDWKQDYLDGLQNLGLHLMIAATGTSMEA